MRSLKPLFLAAGIVVPAAPLLACPEDGGYHRYFAFAGQFQDWQSARSTQPAPARDQQSQPSSRTDSGSSGGSQEGGSSEPAPSSSGQVPGEPASSDAATFR